MAETSGQPEKFAAERFLSLYFALLVHIGVSFSVQLSLCALRLLKSFAVYKKSVVLIGKGWFVLEEPGWGFYIVPVIGRADRGIVRSNS